MGVFLSSCAPNLHSRIWFLKENYKDFEINNSTQNSYITKNNLETNRNNSIKNCEQHWNWKFSEFNEINLKSDISNYSEKIIRPKSMPRYELSILQHEVFLDEIITEKEANIPVVLIHSILLERSDNEQIYLPLGTVLNVISRKNNWLYARTVNGHYCYIDCSACIPLGIFSFSNNEFSSKNTNHASITTPEKLNCVNTINESKLHCSEKDFDLLYLRLTRNQNELKKEYTDSKLLSTKNIANEEKTVILIIKTDYTSKAQNTLNVKKGDIVFFIHCCVKGWFWVRNKNNIEGFIPAATAGYWCA